MGVEDNSMLNCLGEMAAVNHAERLRFGVHSRLHDVLEATGKPEEGSNYIKVTPWVTLGVRDDCKDLEFRIIGGTEVNRHVVIQTRDRILGTLHYVVTALSEAAGFKVSNNLFGCEQVDDPDILDEIMEIVELIETATTEHTSSIQS